MNEYNFLWKGKDPQGNFHSERTTAANAQDAKAQLTQQGWTELELVADEVGSIAGGEVKAAEWMKENGVTPDQETDFFEGKGPKLLTQWWSSLKDTKGTILIFAAFLVGGLYNQQKFIWMFGAAGLALLLLLVPTLHFFFSLTSRQYSRLNQAKIWGRWDVVLDATEKLRKTHRLTRIGVGDIELARCRAQALAGLGRLDDGVREFSHFENSPKLPRWLYYSHLASIYDAAKAYNQSLECLRRATEEKPDNSAVWTGLAYGYVRGFNKPGAAREALARAQSLEITGLGKAYLPFLIGIICWRERKFIEAKAYFAQALEGFRPLKHHDLVQGLIMLSQSYLCAVHGALGNTAEAKRFFETSEKFLIANRENELLEECRTGVGQAGI